MNGTNIIMEEDLPQKPGEGKHLSSITLRGKVDYFHMRCQFKGKSDHFSIHHSSSAQGTPMAMPPKHLSLDFGGAGSGNHTRSHLFVYTQSAWNS